MFHAWPIVFSMCVILTLHFHCIRISEAVSTTKNWFRPAATFCSPVMARGLKMAEWSPWKPTTGSPQAFYMFRYNLYLLDFKLKKSIYMIIHMFCNFVLWESRSLSMRSGDDCENVSEICCAHAPVSAGTQMQCITLYQSAFFLSQMHCRHSQHGCRAGLPAVLYWPA